MTDCKFIDEYVEFGDETQRHIQSGISEEPIPEKRLVLAYLNNRAFVTGTYCKSLMDYVRGEDVNLPVYEFSDGEYQWDSEETYHFDTYNMELKAEFIQKVCSIA